MVETAIVGNNRPSTMRRVEGTPVFRMGLESIETSSSARYEEKQLDFDPSSAPSSPYRL